MVGHPQLSTEEVGRRGQERYENEIRPQVETEDNIGRLVWIDVDSGDYEVADYADFDAPRRLKARHGEAELYALRIGYNAVDTLGGILERVGP